MPSLFYFPSQTLATMLRESEFEVMQFWGNTYHLIITVWKQLGKYHLGPFLPGRQNNYLDFSRWLSWLSKNPVILHSFIVT